MQIFFDLDGPILDVSTKYYKLYTDLLSDSGYESLPLKDYWNAKRERVPEAEIVRRSCPKTFIPEYQERRLKLIETFQYVTHDRVWNGVPELLERLAEIHDLYIVTMRNRREALLRELNHFNLASHFEEIFSRNDNAGTSEVKVELIEGAVLDPDDALIIGDTEVDIQAGKQLGLMTVAVTSGIRSPRWVQRMGADYVLSSSTELTGQDGPIPDPRMSGHESAI